MSTALTSLFPLDFPWCESSYLAEILEMPVALLHAMGRKWNWECRSSRDEDDSPESEPLTEWNVLSFDYGLRERLHTLGCVCDAYCLAPAYLYSLCLAMANDDPNDPKDPLNYIMTRPKDFMDVFTLPGAMRLHLLIRYFSRYQVDFYPEFSLPAPVQELASSVQ